jgi:hypothetical protein
VVPISWTTGTQTEALGVNNAVGTALSNSTVITVVSPPSGAGYAPANFWLPSYGVSKSLLVKASGVMSTTSTPSLTLALLADTSQTSPPANLNLGTSGVVAATGVVAQVASGTNMLWELDVVVSNATTGVTGTALAHGVVKVYTTATAVQTFRISSSAANPNTAVTLNTTVAYYFELGALWSAAAAGNSFQVYSYAVLGLN